jgi:hypothetical protein
MGQSLSGAFPETLKKDFAERNIGIGSVIKIYDSVAGKEKWHLIAGVSDDKIMMASVRINSELNENYASGARRRYYWLIKKEDNAFLEHDSYVDCSKLIISKKEDFVNCVTKNPDTRKGDVQKDKLDNIRATIADCPEITPKLKKQFGLQ